MRKLTHEEILVRQIKSSNLPKVPLVVVLDNIRSLHNVGAIFRTADGLGIEKLWLCGITGYPPQAGIAKTALGAEESVDWEYRESVLEVIEQYRRRLYSIVCLEQIDEAVSLEQCIVDGPTCLVIGNEIDGVTSDAVAQSDMAIEIPMYGVKNSLNVAVAFGIAGFVLRHQLLKKG